MKVTWKRIDYRNNIRESIKDECYSMDNGQRLNVAGELFRDAFPYDPFTGRPSIDAFLETMISSNYGAWTVQHNRLDDIYVISRHKPGNERVREDWDRR
jgi:hypothetical protein